MIQLDEIYDGEVISLKKGKKGIVTIKIDTKVKKGVNENGVFGNFKRKLVRDSLRGRNDCSDIPNQERQEDSGGTSSAENREAGSEA